MRINYNQPMKRRIESHDGDIRQGCTFFIISSFRRVLTWRLRLRVIDLLPG